MTIFHDFSRAGVSSYILDVGGSCASLQSSGANLELNHLPVISRNGGCPYRGGGLECSMSPESSKPPENYSQGKLFDLPHFSLKLFLC